MELIATIADRAVIVRILAQLRLPTDEMLPARAVVCVVGDVCPNAGRWRRSPAP